MITYERYQKYYLHIRNEKKRVTLQRKLQLKKSFRTLHLSNLQTLNQKEQIYSDNTR